MPSEKILSEKQAYVAALREKILNAPAGVIVSYHGITVDTDTKMRSELRAAGADYAVVKNTMLRLALKDTDLQDMESALEGSTALALAGEDDSMAPAKILHKYAEASNGTFALKAGYMDGKAMDVDTIVEIAKLPSREVLLSMLLSGLTGSVRKLAVGLQAVADKKAAEEVA